MAARAGQMGLHCLHCLTNHLASPLMRTESRSWCVAARLGSHTPHSFYVPFYLQTEVGSLNRGVRRIDVSAAIVSTYAGSFGGFGQADGTGPAALFTFPTGVAVNAAGTVAIVVSFGSVWWYQSLLIPLFFCRATAQHMSSDYLCQHQPLPRRLPPQRRGLSPGHQVARALLPLNRPPVALPATQERCRPCQRRAGHQPHRGHRVGH